MVAPPGSGKSTWIKKNSKALEAEVVCPDLIRKEITGDISDVSKDGRVWELARERTKAILSKGNNVILDATNCKTKYRNAFIKDVLIDGVEVRFVLFKRVNPTLCKMRIANDMLAGVDRSKVPAHIVDTMFENYKASVGYLIEKKSNILWID